MPLKMFRDVEKTSLTKVANTIAIAAGKGGVGKSSVTVNLALALREAGFSVGIMDADIYGPSIRKMLPDGQPPAQKGDTIIPAVSEGIRLISMAYFRHRQEATVVRAPIANGIIVQFIKNVEWGNLDYLLIDFPPGTGDIQLTLSQQANLTGAIMVTTPQEVAVMDVRKAMNLFEQVKVPIVGLIENMSHYEDEKTGEKLHLFGEGGGERLAGAKGVPFLGCIPIDPKISHCGDAGRSLFKEAPQNAALKAFREVAKKLAAFAAKSKAECSMESFEMTWKEMPS